MRKFSAFLPAILTSMIFAGSNIAARIVATSCLSLPMMIMIRMALVILCLGIFFRWQPFRQLARQHTWSLLLAGICNLAINVGVFYALRYTSLTNFAMITAINPVLTALLSAVVYRTAISWSNILALVLSLAGVAAVVLGKSGASLVHFNIGDLIAFSVAISWAIYALVVRHISQVLHAKHVNFGTAIITFSLILGFSLFSSLDVALVTELNWQEIWAFGYLGIVGTALAYTLFAYSVQGIGPSLTALLAFSMTPLYTAFLANLLLGDMITSWQLAGGILIMLAVWLAIKDK